MTKELHAACVKAVDMLQSFPSSTRIRVVSHYDADGISAAGVLCSALYRAGYDFHATLMRNPFTKGFDRLAVEKNELIIFSDMGSGQLKVIEGIGCKAIILDHHQPLTAETSDDIIQINANLLGVDGNYEASGATLSYVFATTLDAANEDLASLALAGATGDKQYIGGFRGINKEIIDAALKNGLLRQQTCLKLAGDTLADALFYSIDPYYPGLSGNQKAIDELLGSLHIEAKATLTDVTPEMLMRVQSFLLFMLIKAGCQENILDTVIRTRYISPQGWELERFADLLDACGKNGYRGLGLSLCLGDTRTFHQQSLDVEKEYKKKILNGLQALQHDGVSEKSAMRYFYSENSSLGGVIAGIAMNYVLDEKKPLFSLVRKETDNEIHVSCRGNQMLVAKGLDLGATMKQVASTLGGYGGGHKIAAGATIALQREQEFLDLVDGFLIKQIQRGEK